MADEKDDGCCCGCSGTVPKSELVEEAAENMVEPIEPALACLSRLFFSSKADRGSGCTAFVFEVEKERGRAIGPRLLAPPLLPWCSC